MFKLILYLEQFFLTMSTSMEAANVACLFDIAREAEDIGFERWSTIESYFLFGCRIISNTVGASMRSTCMVAGAFRSTIERSRLYIGWRWRTCNPAIMETSLSLIRQQTPWVIMFHIGGSQAIELLEVVLASATNSVAVNVTQGQHLTTSFGQEDGLSPK
jgi:hypothetical protein